MQKRVWNVEEEISELDNVMANKEETAETVHEATNNLPRAAMALFEFSYKNRGSSSEGSSIDGSSNDESLSQPPPPASSIPVTHCVILWRSRIDC